MKGEKLCPFPSPFSIDLLRAISEKLRTNNLHPIKKTSRKIGNKKNEKLSLAGPHSVMKGTLSQWLVIFLALSEGLMLARKMRRSHPLPFCSVAALQFSRHTTISVQQITRKRCASCLALRRGLTLWRDRAVSSAPPFALTVYCPTHFDLFGLGKKHFSVCNEQLQTVVTLDQLTRRLSSVQCSFPGAL